MTRNRDEVGDRDVMFLYVGMILCSFALLHGGCDKLVEVIPDRDEFLIHGLR